MSHSKKLIVIWLLTGCLLIFIMVIIGGITRLTGSGLSITEWKVITGIIPPLNDAQWQQEFHLYQQSPQYRIINAGFTLHDFKRIYWWEYIHRLTGRITGVVFIIPFLFFLSKKWIDKILLPKLVVIFCLGALQGIVGWLMVYTGLQDRPYVSHFALASHLFMAFITFAYIWKVALDLIFDSNNKYVSHELMGDDTRNGTQNARKHSGPRSFAWIILTLLFLQIIYGAFVAGLKAGYFYNTWPKMNDEWIAESVTFAFERDGMSSLVNNIASVQFIHRVNAILVSVILFIMWIKRKNKAWNLTYMQIFLLHISIGVMSVQFILGILTLVYQVPFLLAILHQACAFVLLASVVLLLHRLQHEARVLQ